MVIKVYVRLGLGLVSFVWIVLLVLVNLSYWRTIENFKEGILKYRVFEVRGLIYCLICFVLRVVLFGCEMESFLNNV